MVDRSAGGVAGTARDWTEGGPAGSARDWARSGVLPLTGHPRGPFLLPPGGAATFASWLGDLVRPARGDAAIDGARLLAERAAISGGVRRGRLSVGGSCRLLPTRDGWAAVSDARPDDPLLWSAAIGRELDARDLPAELAAWLAAHTGDELDERAFFVASHGHDQLSLSQPGVPIVRPRVLLIRHRTLAPSLLGSTHRSSTDTLRSGPFPDDTATGQGRGDDSSTEQTPNQGHTM